LLLWGDEIAARVATERAANRAGTIAA